MSEHPGGSSPVNAGGAHAASKTNPIIVIAAIAVTVFSAVGIGVMTGIIPSSFSRGGDAQLAQTTEPAKAPAPAPAAPQAQPAPTPQVAAAPAPRPRAAAPAPEPVAQEPVRRRQADPDRVAAAREARRTAAARACDNCGRVVKVNVVEQQGEGSGLGAIAGGVAGAVIGNQVGGGSGRKIATVAGAAGGAYAGHQAEKYYKTAKRYDVIVRMEDGSRRTVSYDKEPGYAVGDKVRVVDGKLVSNN